MESLLTLRGRAFELDGIVNNFLNTLLAQAVPTCPETTIIAPHLKEICTYMSEWLLIIYTQEAGHVTNQRQIPKTMGPSEQTDLFNVDFNSI